MCDTPDNQKLPRRLSSRAFSLVELMVVLAVTVLLTGLLLPALSHVRENLHRILCSSNQRQIGLAMLMYASDENEHLPYSLMLEDGRPHELMVAKDSEFADDKEGEQGWDGLGRLYRFGYCPAPECFYCPSHLGSRIQAEYHWWSKKKTAGRIDTNFHYSGHKDWETNVKRSLDRGVELVLAVDLNPMSGELNHEAGLNILHGDGSVAWFEGGNDYVIAFMDSDEGTSFNGIWRIFEGEGFRNRR